MSAYDDGRQYHAAAAYVQVGRWAFTEDELWQGIDDAECAGIPLNEIGRALAANRIAALVALATRNLATLRAIIGDAERPLP